MVGARWGRGGYDQCVPGVCVGVRGVCVADVLFVLGQVRDTCCTRLWGGVREGGLGM